MANTYTKIYIQYVFAVKNRECLLKSNDEKLQKYISGIIANRNSKMLAINNMPDHIHILISQHPSYSISKMAQEIKNNSSKMMNDEKWFSHKFNWQAGYGAFSYGRSQTKAVKKYIFDQQAHHKKHTFKDEYLQLLKIFEIDFDKKYIFDFFEK